MRTLAFAVGLGIVISVSYGMMAEGEMLVGGKMLQPMSFLEEKVMKDGRTLGNLLDEAVTQYNMQSNSFSYFKIADESLKIYSQIVQGESFTVDATMVPTKCTKRGGNMMLGKDLKNCELSEEGHPQPVEFTIWVRGWLKDPEEQVVITFKPGHSLPAK